MTAALSSLFRKLLKRFPIQFLRNPIIVKKHLLARAGISRNYYFASSLKSYNAVRFSSTCLDFSRTQCTAASGVTLSRQLFTKTAPCRLAYSMVAAAPQPVANDRVIRFISEIAASRPAFSRRRHRRRTSRRPYSITTLSDREHLIRGYLSVIFTYEHRDYVRHNLIHQFG